MKSKYIMKTTVYYKSHSSHDCHKVELKKIIRITFHIDLHSQNIYNNFNNNWHNSVRGNIENDRWHALTIK
jgi:hypothetical protein